MSIKLQVKYFSEIPPLEFVGGKSDWIDLRAAQDVYMKQGEFKLIPLGIALKLPHGYEAHLAPRSSTFKKWGIIQTNSVGVIDESYCGDNDQWMMPALCMVESCFIKKGDRIAQFRIMPQMGFFPVEKIVTCPITNINGDTIWNAQRQEVVLEPYDIEFEQVDHLSDEDRGGFGSTGTN